MCRGMATRGAVPASGGRHAFDALCTWPALALNLHTRSHARTHNCAPLQSRAQVIVASCADEKRDPGYWGTARLLLEAGLCLALDQAACDEAGCVRGGVLTPASALGMVLVDRLRRVPGIRFDITASPALGAGAPTVQEAVVAASK